MVQGFMILSWVSGYTKMTFWRLIIPLFAFMMVIIMVVVKGNSKKEKIKFDVTMKLIEWMVKLFRSWYYLLLSDQFKGTTKASFVTHEHKRYWTEKFDPAQKSFLCFCCHWETIASWRSSDCKVAHIYLDVYDWLAPKITATVPTILVCNHLGRLFHCMEYTNVSTPTILPPRVQVPSPTSMLLSFIVKFGLYLSCEKNQNKLKEAGFGPFLKISP